MVEFFMHQHFFPWQTLWTDAGEEQHYEYFNVDALRGKPTAMSQALNSAVARSGMQFLDERSCARRFKVPGQVPHISQYTLSRGGGESEFAQQYPLSILPDPRENEEHYLETYKIVFQANWLRTHPQIRR